MVTRLVMNCLWTNLSLLLQKAIYFYYLAIYSYFYFAKDSSFILVLGKANVKCAQSCIGGRQNLREYLFYIQLLVGFDTLIYQKGYKRPLYLWVIRHALGSWSTGIVFFLTGFSNLLEGFIGFFEWVSPGFFLQDEFVQFFFFPFQQILELPTKS